MVDGMVGPRWHAVANSSYVEGTSASAIETSAIVERGQSIAQYNVRLTSELGYVLGMGSASKAIPIKKMETGGCTYMHRWTIITSGMTAQAVAIQVGRTLGWSHRKFSWGVRPDWQTPNSQKPGSDQARKSLNAVFKI